MCFLGFYVVLQFSLHVLSSATCTDSRSPRFLNKTRRTKKCARPRVVIDRVNVGTGRRRLWGNLAFFARSYRAAGDATHGCCLAPVAFRIRRVRVYGVRKAIAGLWFFIVICQRTKHVSFVVAEAWCMQNAIVVHRSCFVIT